MENFRPVVLTIAGSDSGGGAGIQADLKTFLALDVHGTSAITCLTAQNPDTVKSVFPSSSTFVREQLETLANYFEIQAIKTGMLYDHSIIEEIANFIQKKKHTLVVDPVMVSTSGMRLIAEDAIACLQEKLLPLATLITPNLYEAEVLLGKKTQSPSAILEGAKTLSQKFNSAILIKGGHLNSDDILDLLCIKEGEYFEFKSKRIQNINTHGSGCTLSAAITAYLAKGERLEKAVEKGIEYLKNGMNNPLLLAKDRFISHRQLQ
jgi:hydroxymethylpyrimidine/phosphomethylpyrimidine kinase